MHPSEPTSRPTLYLIDGSAYIYRAFFALPPLMNATGMQTNAIYGFTTTLLKIIREHRPTGLAVAFDEKGPTVRHEAFADYKAHRPPMPEAMQAQIPYIHRVVDAFQVPALRMAGYEADDLIGTLAKKAEPAGWDVVIVTGDKDMFQLLTPRTRIYDPVKDKWSGEAECRERFGVEPSRVVEVMGLMGDATDNIPGVKGIGEKTAVKLIQQFGTIEAVLARVEEVSAPRLRTLLKEQAEQARMSRTLATIHTDCAIDFEAQAFHVVPPEGERVAPLLRELGFISLLKSLKLKDATADSAPLWQIVEATSERDLAAIADKATTAGHVTLQWLLRGTGITATLRGILMSVDGQSMTFASSATLMHSAAFATLLANRTISKISHDWKLAVFALSRAGLTVNPPWIDTMIGDYLLHPNRRAHTIEAAALDLLGESLPTLTPDTQAPQAPASLFDGLDDDTEVLDSRSSKVQQAAGELYALARLAPRLTAQLEEQGSLRLFEEVEMALIPVLVEIERNGFSLDVQALHHLGQELDRELDRMMTTIAGLAGETFNINSPKQLATILFEKLGLKPLRKTKTGYSTDEDTLTQLAAQHELPSHILNYRSLSKLQSTYVEALPNLVNPETGRIHTSLNQTVAATGRLSSTDPNLQNIPVKGEYGLRIREAFICAPGHTLLCADYSQIEPRILAHLSQDPRLLTVFQQGEDIHTATAVDIFNLPADHITRDMRRVAKTVVFGILYGISPFGLASNLSIPQQDAKKYIDAYFERYAGVKAYIDRTVEEAKQHGYVTTMLGRRRPIPELLGKDPTQRSFGERIAMNSPIQGSAADLIKLAMLSVSHRIKTDLPGTKMILQVHDELIFEVPESEIEPATRLIRHEMEHTGNQLGLSVPLKVDVGTGHNWRVAHP